MRVRIPLGLAALVVPIFVALLVLVPQSGGSVSSAPVGNRVLARARDIALGYAQRKPHEQPISGGPLFAVLESTGALTARAGAANAPTPNLPPQARTQGCQNVSTSSATNAANVRVNQDCSLRRQAEETIAINPTNVRNLIVGQNDSRIGYNHCGYDWSMDGGNTWGDQLPPFYQFALADGHNADACSDPTATFDSAGNAYVGGVLFDINSPASAFAVAKSNFPIGGAFYHSPVSQTQQIYVDLPLGVIASDNDPNIFNDKELIMADGHLTSPKANRVYATWTRFNLGTGTGVGLNSPINFSQSTDGGATWSPGIEISGANAAVCTTASGETNANACDQDQGSDPIVGLDGTIYVSFNNGNTPTLGLNQFLVVSCPVAADCTNPASWTTPAKAADDFAMQPFGPDTVTGCPAGFQCLPPNGYRLGDSTTGTLSVDNRNHLFFTWSDFRNGGGTCTPLGSVQTATPPCDNDVFYASSSNLGLTWTAAFDLTPAARFGQTAQWQSWSSVTPSGDGLWVAYYDRSYGTCEFTGCNDITLARVKNPLSGAPSIDYSRLTTSSMPNLVVANNVAQAGFLGDYMWVAVDPAGHPYVVWADTRGLGGAVEEDVYFAKPAT